MTCVICFGLFLNPVACSDCENMFCRECIDTFEKKNKVQNRCPTC